MKRSVHFLSRRAALLVPSALAAALTVVGMTASLAARAPAADRTEFRATNGSPNPSSDLAEWNSKA
ncbi:hypothetical protein [Streptomyces sp. NPDC050485]|uniref:hypothetical protein n=1 Tax=Streptomyces sp. NPDC050485 TaxID=3365617 RepID=UPI0037BCF9CC